mgnify:CR=1 FL=1
MKSTGTTHRLVRLVAWLVFAWGALVLLTLPVRRYDWMQQMDLSISAPPDAGSDNGALFVLLLLGVIVASQVAIMTLAKTGRERTRALVLALVAVALWASRFWR